MFNRNGRAAVRDRRLAVIAGAIFATASIALTVTAEAPARSEEHVPQAVFDEAFAPFALARTDAMASPEQTTAAPVSFAASRVVEEPVATRPAGSGMASYYGAGFAGRPTASGERFNPSALTAAHRTLPLGTRLRVTNPRNGRSVVVRVNDRGPFHSSRVIDLSQEAARQIGIMQQGSGVVQLAALTS